MKRFVLILAALLFPILTFAHGGGTDSSGGHNCRTGSCAGTYHYHNSGYTKPTPSYSYTTPTYKKPTYTAPKLIPKSSSDVFVKGYYRKNGTYVKPYYRSKSDGVFGNNFSSYGNVNPYTGKIGTKKSNYSSKYTPWYSYKSQEKIYDAYGNYITTCSKGEKYNFSSRKCYSPTSRKKITKPKKVKTYYRYNQTGRSKRSYRTRRVNKYGRKAASY